MNIGVLAKEDGGEEGPFVTLVKTDKAKSKPAEDNIFGIDKVSFLRRYED